MITGGEIKNMLENVDTKTFFTVNYLSPIFASVNRPGYIVFRLNKVNYDKLKEAHVSGLVADFHDEEEARYGVRAWFRAAEIPHPTLIYGTNKDGFAVGLSIDDLIGDRGEWHFFHILHIDLLPMKWYMEDGSRSGITIFIDTLKISKAEPERVSLPDYIHRKEI